jgi:hypothetical protein
MPDSFVNVYRAEIVSLAARYHLPSVYPWRFFAELGGLLSYGSEQGDMFRLAATYVDRILKGEKGTWPNGAKHVARKCRRGDRIATLFAAYAHSRFWHFSD